MSELKPKTHEPCWHCTGKSFTIPYAQNGGRYILCGSCGAASPVKDTEILARIAWNSRPLEKALQAKLTDRERMIDESEEVEGLLNKEIREMQADNGRQGKIIIWLDGKIKAVLDGLEHPNDIAWPIVALDLTNAINRTNLPDGIEQALKEGQS